MFNRTSLHELWTQVCGCKSWREGNLQTSSQHVATFLPFSSLQACRLFLSSAQEQTIAQRLTSGPPAGFDWFSPEGNQLALILKDKLLVPVPWKGQATLSPASKHPKWPQESRELGRLHVAEAVLLLLGDLGLLHPQPPCAWHPACRAELIQPQINTVWF